MRLQRASASRRNQTRRLSWLFGFLPSKAVNDMNIGYVGEGGGESPLDRTPIVGNEESRVQMTEGFVSGKHICWGSRAGKVELAAAYVGIRPKAVETVIATVNRKYLLAEGVLRRIRQRCKPDLRATDREGRENVQDKGRFSAARVH